MIAQDVKMNKRVPFAFVAFVAFVIALSGASPITGQAASLPIIFLAKPLYVNAATSQELGTWSLNNQVSFQLESISMVSSNDGWAVGFEGYAPNGVDIGSVLLHWDGSAWNRVTSPINIPLYAVKMISATDGWAVGKGSIILHWNGSAWSLPSSYCGYSCVYLYSIDFTSANDVWAGGDGGFTHWDGSTWSYPSMYSGRLFTSVSAISADDVWMVGRYGSGPLYQMLIAHWNGNAWIESIQNIGNYGLNAVDMLSSSEGWAVGSHYISHYTGSWEISSVSYPSLTSLEMLSANDGWVVGGTTNIVSTGLGLILHWDGNTWNVIDNPASKMLVSIDMLSANEGWAVGYDGIILHYTNYRQVYLPLVIR